MAILVRGTFGGIGTWRVPFRAELADPGYERHLGPQPRTTLADGIRKTVDEFAALQRSDRLDANELEPANP